MRAQLTSTKKPESTLQMRLRRSAPRSLCSLFLNTSKLVAHRHLKVSDCRHTMSGQPQVSMNARLSLQRLYGQSKSPHPGVAGWQQCSSCLQGLCGSACERRRLVKLSVKQALFNAYPLSVKCICPSEPNSPPSRQKKQVAGRQCHAAPQNKPHAPTAKESWAPAMHLARLASLRAVTCILHVWDCWRRGPCFDSGIRIAVSVAGL